MYLNHKEKLLRSIMKLNWESANCILIFSVPDGKRKCFVRGSDTRRKEGRKALL